MTGAPGILLVDDHPENLLALEAILEPLGVECVRATSGFEALRKLLRHDFAAILLDVQLPDMDGFETAAIIKRRRRSRDVPIVFVTGSERDPAAAARGYSVGAVDYVTKPFDPELLRQKISALVELHQKDVALRESEDRFRAAFEHAPIGIALMSPDGRWMDVNHALAELLERPPWALIASPPFDLPALAAQPLSELLAASRGSFSCEATLQSGRGDTLWVTLHVSLVRDRSDEPLHLICQLEDVTERKRAEESLTARIAYLAYHDELTGLPNRAMFGEHLELALARADRNLTATAVLYLDLNRFKLVNDSLGHAAGDELLRQAATRLTRAVRASDLVARVGGDEFIVLLTDLDPAGALAVAELVSSGIHDALNTPFVISGAEFYVGTSVGIALRGDDERADVPLPDVEALLRYADAAMYDAKQSGSPSAVYAEPMGEPLERLALVTRLRKAVDRMDFVLHWMPIVDLDTQTVCGVEALIRWHDSERGWVPPDEFIALLEDSGLIDRVGLWVLGEAARCEARWGRRGVDMDIAVNISARQLWQAGAAERMLDAITAEGGDPTRFMLEIAEASASRPADRSSAALAALREAGVRIAIDDFAHSPLTALSRMEFDVLKLDGSLVAAAELAEGETLINAIINLARNLGIWPLAERIETRRQYELLRGSGCRFGQGHFFAHPMPGDDVPDFVRGFTVSQEVEPWVRWEALRAREFAI